MRRANRAELIIEYALVVGVVTGALLAMQTYMKRGIQGVIKTTADELAAPALEYYQPLGMPRDSQLIGAREKGLFNYSVEQNPQVTVNKNINLIEPQVKDPYISITSINPDQTTVSGTWSVIYNAAEDATFTAQEKAKVGKEVGSVEVTAPTINK